MDTLSLLAIFSASCIFSWLLGRQLRLIGIAVTSIELLLGFIIGNWLIPYEQAKAIAGISEIGALALFFLVGLHTNVNAAKEFSQQIGFVIGIGAATPLIIMPVIYPWLDLTPTETLFAISTIMATGVGVVMRVLQEYRYSETKSGSFLLSCSVLEDIPAILMLSLAAAFAKHGGLGSGMLFSLLPIVALGIGGMWIIKASAAGMQANIPQPLLLPVMIIAAWMTHRLGITSLFGAFFIGLLCRSSRKEVYEEYTKPIMDFFIPVFFIMVGMQVKLETIIQPESWSLGLTLTAIAFASRLLCYLGIGKKAKLNGIDAWAVTAGMIPRGVPGLVFATVALSSGYIGDILFSALIIMVTTTNIIGLSLLSYRLRRYLVLQDK